MPNSALSFQSRADEGPILQRVVNDVNSFLSGDKPTSRDYWNGNVDYARQLELLGLQNQFTADQNAKMMAFNADEAQKAREWQEMMSNTAYSRAMADAKKAGINPALIFSQGGASTPTGSSAYANVQGSTSPSRGYNNVANVVGALTGLAGSAMRLMGMLGLKKK